MLSYFIGWFGILGYQIGTTIGAFVAGTMIQGVIILNNPETYTPQRWHGTLIAMAITISVALFNILLANHLPLVEGIILVLHIAGFVAIMVPLWVMAPRTPTSEVWTSFTDANAWGSGNIRRSLVEEDELTLHSWSRLPDRYDYQRWRFCRRRCRSAYGRGVEERLENPTEGDDLDYNRERASRIHHACVCPLVFEPVHRC